jgi:hypothetical protein
MAVFYGLWTWLIHNLFDVKVVYLPSGELQMRDFIKFTLIPVLGGCSNLGWGGQMCKTHGQGEKYMLNLSQKTQKEETTWETYVAEVQMERQY